MSSINPLILLPGAMAARPETIGRDFVASLTMGSGQYCTNPGLVLAVVGPGFAEFMQAAAEAVSASPATTMLTPAIHGIYTEQTGKLAAHGALKQVARGQAPNGPHQCQAALMLVEQGNITRGLPLLQKATTLAPEAAEIRYHFVLGLVKSGDKAKARKELEQLLATGKTFSGIEEAKALLKQL